MTEHTEQTAQPAPGDLREAGGPARAARRPAPAASPAPAAPQQAPAHPEDGLLDLVDQAVVVCDADGVVLRTNAPAGRLFPRLRVGEVLGAPAAGPLAAAAADGSDAFDADFLGRRLSGRRTAWDGRTVWLVRDDSAVREREDALLAERSRSAFLAQAGKQLGASLHHGRTVRTLVRTAVPVLADSAVVVLPLRGNRTTWHRFGPHTPEPVAGRIAAAVLEGVPRVADALSGLEPEPTACPWQELEDLGVVPQQLGEGGEALVIPLPGNGVPAGALVLARGPDREGFTAVDTELVRQFASRAGIALAASAFYTQQSHTASVLQSGLEPAALPAADGVRLGAAYRPAREALRIGGDFYQVDPRPGGGLDFFFGDVCGKGVEAAVLTGRVRQSLRTLALVEIRPVRVLHLLNQALLDAGEARFTTLVTGSARSAADGGLDVVLAGGGHLPPLVLRDDGRVEPVQIGGTLVGALPDPIFDQAEIHLAPGELVLLYSDGVTEARGGPAGYEMYGERRLVRDLATCRGMPAGAVAQRVELLATEWLGGRPHDDIAVLVLQAPARTD
ncbi:PP2C family protein-serine/threonine phosphatase [Streptomyces sp. NPDC001380]|uniref:PP2C family protein-serine/threonine phosphatase n=1 Tax=Streptomyces sp. NPDC001380 TaxID=3364566 RepID=UPI00367CF6DD